MKLTVIYTNDVSAFHTGGPITQRQVTITLTEEQAKKLRRRIIGWDGSKGSPNYREYKEKIGPIVLTMEDGDE